MFNRMHFLIENMDSNIQPVFVNDVVMAMNNCLLDESTIGQSYDLGGPHTYKYSEIYHHFFDLARVKPYTATVPYEKALEYYQYGDYLSFYRQLVRTWLYPEWMTLEAQNLVVNPENKGFADLSIKPVSFGQRAEHYVQEIYWLNNLHTETKREEHN
jgi:NADH dehydrogenase (ubiquinone) 1 alpha subcomplex subunit 9